jgi:uncharacterized protein YdhG (YjbR/CyaY superfamily)
MATTTATKKKATAKKNLSDVELMAMKETLAERRRERSGKADGEADLQAKIAEMEPDEKAIASRLHAIITKNAPGLSPKTWYGMPAWANKDGKPVVFFQPATKFKARYSTLGFQDPAKLDEGNVWPTSYAVLKIGPADEARIIALVKKAAG